MILDTCGGASSSPGNERPTLGTDVRTILVGWNRAVRTCTPGSQRIRALLFLGTECRELGWHQDAIHRICSHGESRPVTESEWELIARAISYGWFLVYRLEAEGHEATVLHQVGVLVPGDEVRREDLALLLQEHELSPPREPDTSSSDGQSAARAVRGPVPPSTSVSGSSPSPVRANHRPGQGKRSTARELRSRLLPYFLMGGGVEIGLLLGLWLTRKVVFGLGMLAILIGLITIGLIVTRKHLHHSQDQKRGQPQEATH